MGEFSFDVKKLFNGLYFTINSKKYILILRYCVAKTVISGDGRFEWDSDKDRKNYLKHGIHFAEILEVFDDPAFLEGYDIEHSFKKEDRYYGIGSIRGLLVILVFYTDRESRIRLISARQADPEDRKRYNEHFREINT